MPKEETILRVLVASPQDVREERARLEQLIRRQNGIWSLSNGIRLDLVRWETDAFPGVGTDAQAVINEQIGDDYDIFVGIMWTRVGTRTTRAPSGTIEEFNRAYQRFQDEPEALRIMFYFSETPIPPNELDPEQFAALMEFRQSLEERGVLYFTFSDANEFEELLSLHLTRQILDYGEGWGSPSSGRVVKVEPQEEVSASSRDVALFAEGTEDEGFLDVIEQGSEDFQTMTQSLQRMSETVRALGTRLEKRNEEMGSASSKEPVLFMKLARQITNRTASHLDAFVSQISTELPSFSESLSGAVTNVAKAASLAGEFDVEDTESIASLLEMVVELRTSTEGAQAAAAYFRGIIESWPPVATKLNRAKARALTTVDELISELEKGVRLMSAVEEEIRRILGQEE